MRVTGSVVIDDTTVEPAGDAEPQAASIEDRDLGAATVRHRAAGRSFAQAGVYLPGMLHNQLPRGKALRRPKTAPPTAGNLLTRVVGDQNRARRRAWSAPRGRLQR